MSSHDYGLIDPYAYYTDVVNARQSLPDYSVVDPADWSTSRTVETSSFGVGDPAEWDVNLYDSRSALISAINGQSISSRDKANLVNAVNRLFGDPQTKKFIEDYNRYVLSGVPSLTLQGMQSGKNVTLSLKWLVSTIVGTLTMGS